MRSIASPLFKLSLFTWCIFASIFCCAQGTAPPPVKDLAEIKQLPASQEKVSQLIRYARSPRTIYSNEIKNLLEEALVYTKTIARDDLTASVLGAKSIVELGLGNQDLAITDAKQAETYISKLPDGLALTILSDLSRIYGRSGDDENSKIYFDKIEAFTKEKPQFIIARILNLRNRTNLEVRNGNTEKVLTNYELALNLAKQSNNLALLKDTRFAYANMLLNIRKEDEAFSVLKELIPDLENTITDKTAQFFAILSRNYEKNGDYTNAFIYAEKEFNLANATVQQKSSSINRMILFAYLLNNYKNIDPYYLAHQKYGANPNSLFSRKQYQLAESIYFDVKKNYKLAKANYIKGYNLKAKNEIAPYFDIIGLLGLTKIYYAENKPDSVKHYLNKAKILLKPAIGLPSLQLLYTETVKKTMANIPIAQDTLVQNFEHEIRLRDTLYQMRLSKLSNELATRYKVNEKEKALALIKKQQQLQALELKYQKKKQLIIILISALATLFFAGFTYILIQRKKQATLLHNATLTNLKKQHQLDIMHTLEDAQETEKKRVAERLHDEVGAMLSIAKLNINTLQHHFKNGDADENKFKTTQNLINDISTTVRNISHSLMPIALEKYGFKSAILDLIASINTTNALHIEHVLEGLENTDNWPQNFKIGTYRIIQELLNNVIKHANASHVFIQVVNLQETITIYIEDNGRGISTNQANGKGLKLLATNIDFFAGKIEIRGEPNIGTFALIELPIPTNKV